MKKIFVLIIVISINSCSSSQKTIIKEKSTTEEKCPKIYKKNYTEILNVKHETIVDKDTLKYNEMRFECVYSAMYTHKIMFDKFGKWDKSIYPNNKRHPILVWKKVDLYSNGKKYNVYTNGIEEWKHIYASVMIFDENGKDLLSIESAEKESLTNFFANLIKRHNMKKGDFHEIYWKMVDPKRWETIKAYQKN